MNTTEICPVCKGSGKYKKDSLPDSISSPIVCHGCNGKGWVVIPMFSPRPLCEYRPYRPYTTSGTMLASENVLRKDWDTPEEDKAWANL
ncbi:unnamed protein product [marine sediment metagenome]|uniref:Uncharacterized protein n=1 Tax=marine sediment metagenome TaxID=412755 RepID=X1GJM5_9ZZZZ